MSKSATAKLCSVLVVCISLTVPSLSIAGLFSHSPLELSSSVLEKNKGDMEGLMKAWIFPLMKNGAIHDKQANILDDQGALMRGFSKFCHASGGKIADRGWVEYGFDYACRGIDGQDIGELSVKRYQGNDPTNDMWLAIGYDSAAQREAREQAKRDFEAEQNSNGPTGWVETADGRQRVIRFGTLSRRLVLRVGSIPGLPLDSVSTIRFDGCCRAVLGYADQPDQTVNTSWIWVRTSASDATSLPDALPFVELDPVSQQPYTKLIQRDAIKAIGIDAGGPQSTLAIDGPIPSRLSVKELQTPERAQPYLRALQAKADALQPKLVSYILAQMSTDERRNYANKSTLPLTPKAWQELEKGLRWRCGSLSVDTGLYSLDDPARCIEADKELYTLTALPPTNIFASDDGARSRSVAVSAALTPLAVTVLADLALAQR